VREFLQQAVYGTDPLPVEDSLKTLGFQLQAKDPDNRCDWGLTTNVMDDFTNVRQVRNGSCGERAGIAPGDLIVAIDGFRATAEQVKRMLSRKRPGDVSRVHVMRREQLMELELHWEAAGVQEWKVLPV